MSMAAGWLRDLKCIAISTAVGIPRIGVQGPRELKSVALLLNIDPKLIVRIR
jgi:hypothetical protein